MLSLRFRVRVTLGANQGAGAPSLDLGSPRIGCSRGCSASRGGCRGQTVDQWSNEGRSIRETQLPSYQESEDVKAILQVSSH
jgi:hypothetical protein